MAQIMTPDQKPKHKEHLNRFLKKENLDSKFLGQERIVPYFNIKVRPTHAISVNVILIGYLSDLGIDNLFMAA